MEVVPSFIHDLFPSEKYMFVFSDTNIFVVTNGKTVQYVTPLKPMDSPI